MSDVEPEMPVDEDANADRNGECFVIAPIGDPRTETRRQTDGLLREAIRPVIEDDLGLEVTAAHELPEAGSITRQVLQHLLEAELVVADLTDLNANVMYELAVRHAKGRPVVPIAERGTSLPFDITTERTIFYEEGFHGLSKLKPKLVEAAQAALEDQEPDNPIYRAKQDFAMREAVAGDDKMEFILDRLDDIESSLSHTRSGIGCSSDEEHGAFSYWEMHVDGADDSLENLIERLERVGEDLGIPFRSILEPGEDYHRLVIYGGGLNRDNHLQVGDAVTKEINRSDVELL